MKLPKEVFLEQIIDNIGFFECTLKGDVKSNISEQPLLHIKINPAQIERLNIGYYYDLEQSREMTPYSICENYDIEDGAKYINLKINMEKTNQQKKLVSTNYRIIYLLSRFFSRIYFTKIYDKNWSILLKAIENAIFKNQKDYMPSHIAHKAILNIIMNNSNIISIAKGYEHQFYGQLDNDFVELCKERKIGSFYASLILHTVCPNQAMIYNEDCYKFLCDCSLLQGKGIQYEYGKYSYIICDRINMIQTQINKNNSSDISPKEDNNKELKFKNFEKFRNAAYYIKNFVYSDYLNEML